MNENPYQAPASAGEAYGVLSGRREDVRSVAVYQRGILVCILLNLLLFVCRAGVPESMRIFIFIPYLVIGIAGLIYVVLRLPTARCLPSACASPADRPRRAFLRHQH